MKILQVHSTFHVQTQLKSVMFQPPDPRFIFINTIEEKSDFENNKKLVLEPQTNNTVSSVILLFMPPFPRIERSGA